MEDELTIDGAVVRCLDDAQNRVSADAEVETVVESEFPNSALGAPRAGELALQVVTPGWKINVVAHGQELEYRANSHQVRLVGFEGENIVIYPPPS